MRLLNAKTHQLEEFIGDRIPPYAILSHTWGEEEVTFQDLQHPSHKKKRGYDKICQTCLLAVLDKLKWVWIDTCCIDKSSSAELSEAINSMFDWYAAADVCYVFLEDVPPSNLENDVAEAFRNARWLTRGWTLQEFLAPSFIVLLNSSWERIKRIDFPLIRFPYTDSESPPPLASMLVQHYTGIEKKYWRNADVPTILSWAARRQTSRREDMAYCLLGLLGVKMPLIYGEGSEAFPRLLEEVIKKSNSHGVLAAWYGSPSATSPSEYSYVLPRLPAAYLNCAAGIQDVSVPGKSNTPHFSLTNAGLSIELPLFHIDSLFPIVLGLLNCRDATKDDLQVAIVLIKRYGDQYGQFYHRASQALSVPLYFHQHAHRKSIYITNPPLPFGRHIAKIDYTDLLDLGYTFSSLYPPCTVEKSSRGIVTSFLYAIHGTLFLLLTTDRDLPNIVVFILDTLADSRDKSLISLTDSASLIEFLLKENDAEHDRGLNPSLTAQHSRRPPSSWSTRIDLNKISARSCWGDGIDISLPESPSSQKRSFRISAKFDFVVMRSGDLRFFLRMRMVPCRRTRSAVTTNRWDS